MVRRPAKEAYDEAPELTEVELAEMRPAREVHNAEEFAALTAVRKRGRPFATIPKVPVTIRLDPRVVEAFKLDGPGWQTRINATLLASLAPATPADDEGKPVKKGKRTRSYRSRRAKAKVTKRGGKAQHAA